MHYAHVVVNWYALFLCIISIVVCSINTPLSGILPDVAHFDPVDRSTPPVRKILSKPWLPLMTWKKWVINRHRQIQLVSWMELIRDQRFFSVEVVEKPVLNVGICEDEDGSLEMHTCTCIHTIYVHFAQQPLFLHFSVRELYPINGS